MSARKLPPRASIDVSAVRIAGLTHRYGERTALDQLELTIERGELFAIVGPNGGGKTTLFRLLSTLIPPQSGQVEILGFDLSRDAAAIRSQLGVVFQAPSLDKHLTVSENLLYQGPLYGLRGVALRSAHDRLLTRLGVKDRAHDFVQTLSGGLRRRVELAKGLLHAPPLLLLDEPSTGLDPGARSDLWNYLREIRDADGVTVVLTTHLLEEAEKADRLAIIDRGKRVALGTPAELRATVGGDSLVIETDAPELLAGELKSGLGITPRVVGEQLRIEAPDAHRLIAQIIEAKPNTPIRSITLRQPSLEDVFIAQTGHQYWSDASGRVA